MTITALAVFGSLWLGAGLWLIYPLLVIGTPTAEQARQQQVARNQRPTALGAFAIGAVSLGLAMITLLRRVRTPR
jgi:hypothetical protein